MTASASRDVIIGIDAGTSLIKAVAFTLTGEQLADVSQPNAYNSLTGGHVEQDMARTWTDTVAVIRALAKSVPDLSARIAVIAVTGQGDGTWLIDDDGRPVAAEAPPHQLPLAGHVVLFLFGRQALGDVGIPRLLVDEVIRARTRRRGGLVGHGALLLL